MIMCRYYVGIDWADQKHDIAMVDSQGNVIVDNFTIAKSARGFELLLDILRAHSGNPAHFKIGIETQHNLLVDFLLDLGYPVYVLHPGSMKGLRKQYRPSGASDDRFDAFVLAIALLHNRYCWRAIDLGSELVREIRLLARDHFHLTRMRTALLNTLSTAVKMYYPEYLLFFSKFKCKTSLAFLKACPDFEAARQLTFKQLTDFFKEQRCYRCNITKIYEVLQQDHLTAPPPLLTTKRLRARNCLNMLAELRKDIETFEKRIEALVTRHPDGKRFLTCPGVAYISAARLLALFGDNRNLYTHVSQLQGLVGTCPVTEKSGNIKRNIYFRRACNKFYRHTLNRIAFASLKKSKWANAYFQKHRAMGKKHNHALRCLANLQLRIFFAMWKHETDYDENIFLADKTKHKIKTEFNQLFA
jgi:transposase